MTLIPNKTLDKEFFYDLTKTYRRRKKKTFKSKRIQLLYEAFCLGIPIGSDGWDDNYTWNYRFWKIERFVYSVKAIICILLGFFNHRSLFTNNEVDESIWNNAISIRMWGYRETGGEFYGHDWEELTVCRGFKFRVSVISNGDN